HSCRLDEVVGALQEIARRFAPRPMAVAGFSLGGNFALRVAPGAQVPVTAGIGLADAAEVANLVVGLGDGRPLLLSDVADVRAGADLPRQYVWHAQAGAAPGSLALAPAVTIAVAKQPGANATDITRAILSRLDALRATHLPDSVRVTTTRDYGRSADDKAATLIRKLVFATLSVVLLVLFALGWREALVVGSAVVLTLALTLFASWALGFTINRVSLFALIFSIGILVDDAIVVVENIHRHRQLGAKSLREAIPLAVDEVGAPTILATFTVIAALLPMAFVSGLMGPYMRPIPINASAGMLISLLIALTVTPWLAARLLSRHGADGAHGSAGGGRLTRVFRRVLAPFLDPARGGRHRLLLFGGMAAAVLFAALLAVFELVVLKMLPFDNKSEFQVVADLPEGTPLERTNALLIELAQALVDVPEVTHVQGYAGTAAPVNFNGLVRQYYLRSGANVGDLQVNLVDKHDRSRKSHDIARAVRPRLADIGRRYGASIKVTEVPPGPPVMAPLVAEIYGPDAARAQQIARAVQTAFAATPGLVDIDTSLESDAPRELVAVDRERAARLGISQQQVAEALALAVSGSDASYLRDGASKYPVPIRLRLPAGEQADLAHLLAIRVRAADGRLVPLSELVRVQTQAWEQTRYHKDLAAVVYVTADEAGALDSPLYGMFGVVSQLRSGPVAGETLAQHFFSVPADAARFAVKWDGEWQITYETFRDMGLAYSAGLVLIYLLVVAQFRSYVVPLIIMAPIPLTAIGVLPGHALLGAQFTATSMIGMIALAGIIVRNSILLVDFVNQALAEGRALADAVVDACAVRAQPIALTAVAAMAGAFFILDDPIFNGLAISLIFGILVSTVLTLFVIPLLYYALLRGRGQRLAAAPDSSPRNEP
uniref:efflux RND transporter permease subunit n=1 Tax=Tahibacter caeni TaxID=1453545 RepID=UPI002148A712